MRSIAESDESGQIAVTTFEHDARRRLCRETRVAADPQMWSHELSYTYDDNGNRRSEHRRYTLPPDEVFERNVTYVYDLDDPATYGTMQNRLMAVSGDESRTYYYDEDGNVWRIIEGSLRTDLEYDKMGRVWRAWGYNQGDDVLWAHEFRYAGARQRYLVRELDPGAWEWHDVRWSDYLGNSIWGDYTVDGGTATMTTRYVPGLWQTDLTPLGDDPPGAPTTAFVHTNQLGTTRLLSDESGSAVDLGVGSALQHYTAFGRPFIVDDDPPEGSSYALPTRYGYAGAWGYDSQSGIGALMHVGARYYDPRIGRFLQRDPIGIAGGLNVYAYVGNDPLTAVDPLGLYDWEDFYRDGADVVGILWGAGSAIALACGGAAAPGANLYLSAGVLAGAIGAADLFHRYMPAPPPGGGRDPGYKAGCHGEPHPWWPPVDPHGLPPGTDCRNCHAPDYPL